MALVVFTGGARCGKTAIAENLAFKRARVTGQRVVTAVFADASEESDLAEQNRNVSISQSCSHEILKAYDDPLWIDRIAPSDILIVDCLATALISLVEAYETNHETYQDSVDDSPDKQVVNRFNTLTDRLMTRPGDTIIVTNQVGSGLTPQYDSARLYRNLLGYANNTLIASADTAYLVFCGRLIEFTALPDCAQWPED